MKKMPAVNEVPEAGFLIEIDPDSVPDGLGRQGFTLFWRDAYLPPSGVRAQRFFAVPQDKINEWDQNGTPWDHWSA